MGVIILNMIYSFKRTDVMAIQDHLTLQLVPILLDMVVFHHNNNHIYLVQELVEVQNLVLHDFLLSEEGIEGL